MLVPDLAGWRRERLSALPDESFFALRPDRACEVLSPSTSSLDRAKKRPNYARVGIRHLWLLDPEAHTLEVYDLDAGRWVLVATHGGSEMIRAVPFQAVNVDLARLWGGRGGKALSTRGSTSVRYPA